MARRGRKGAAGRKPVRPKVLVLCQGTETEPKYLQLLKQKYRIPNVVIDKEALDPKKLVERAGARIGRDGSLARVFVVVDVDNFTPGNFQQAVKACRKVGTPDCSVDLVVSNESFDFWLYAHVAGQKLPNLGRGHYQKRLVREGHLTGRNGKTLSSDFPVGNWGQAETYISPLRLNEVGENLCSAMPAMIRELIKGQ